VADWVTISSLATAGGTLVLAVATFSSVRSANRSARVAERSLTAGVLPVLIPSREEDPPERLRFGDEQMLTVPGHGGSVVLGDDVIYMAIGLRNGGSGLAVMQGWHVQPRSEGPLEPPPLEQFRRQQLDLYIPAGDYGYWLGALRDPTEPGYDDVRSAIEEKRQLHLDLMYSDYEGGQRTIARFMFTRWADKDVQGMRASVLRYWNVDRDDPRVAALP
jgi:hypothetical protein